MREPLARGLWRKRLPSSGVEETLWINVAGEMTSAGGARDGGDSSPEGGESAGVAAKTPPEQRTANASSWRARVRAWLRVVRVVPVASFSVFTAALPHCNRKADECNVFISRANETQQKLDALRTGNDEPRALLARAKEIDDEARAIESLSLKDGQLVGYRAAYVSNLTRWSGVLRRIAELRTVAKEVTTEAALAEARGRAEQIDQEASDVQKEGTQLVRSINAYCSP